MNVPGGTVPEGETLNGDVFAVLQEKQVTPVGAVFALGVDPPDAVLRPAVDDPFTDDPDILHADTGQCGRKGIG